MQSPSVLFINRVYPPFRGSTGRVLRDLAHSFSKEGWQVTVLTTGPKAGKQQDGGVKVIRVKGAEKPRGAMGYLWIWLKLLYVALRLPSRDLVVTMSDPPLLVIAGDIIRKRKKCRHINWCHDIYPDLFPALGIKFPAFFMKRFRIATRRAMKSADRVIVVGRCMARYLVKTGLPSNAITMIPNWPDPELELQPEEQDDAGYVPASFAGRPPNEQLKDGPKFRVLYAGNIGLAHPIDTILGAAEILKPEFPEIEFTFVGDGRRFDALAQERTRRGLNNIRFLPYQPASRLRTIMESGDIHIVSMIDSAAGMLVPSKLYSALAVQRPCVFVGPTLSESAKIIKDYNAGVIVPQGNAEELATRIKEYRFNSDDWFAAQKGAAEASKVFLREEAAKAWISRAWKIVKDNVTMTG